MIDLSHDCTCVEKRSCSAQNRFDRTVSRFMEKWDGEHNLVIVYYTGLGSHVPESETAKAHLSLHAYAGLLYRVKSLLTIFRTADSVYPDVHWDEAERNFVQSARGDVLTIMDACFAGNVTPTVNRAYENMYEYVGACHKGKMTSSPGNKSFTSALIASLNHLFEIRARQSFTTPHLVSTIAEQPWRIKSPPFFDSRGASSPVDRRIFLAPQKRFGETCFENIPIPTYLTLRIEPKDETLDPDQGEELARKVARAVKSSKIRTRRVDWVRLGGRKSTSFRAAAWSVVWISMLGRPRKNTLQSVPEEPNIEPPISRPGIWATFGVLTPWKHSHTLTVPLMRPWTRVVGGSLGLAIIFGAYCIQRQISPVHLLYMLLAKLQPLGKGLG